jgi:ArsR family transcriptional regulator
MFSTSDYLATSDLPLERAEQIAQIFAALGDPTRARIVYLLTQGEHSVNVLAEIAGVSASAVSHHLARLRDVRLVKARRRGNQVFYSVDDEHVSTLYRQVLHHLAHLKESLPEIPPEEIGSIEPEKVNGPQ